MKRIVASLLILLGPLVVAPRASATTGGSPTPRLKPLALDRTRWVSDIEYLISQNAADDRATDAAAKKPAERTIRVRDNAGKKSSHMRAHSHRSPGAVSSVHAR
jgi:hypothetical protein